jgi:hypothetical protein
MCTDICSEYLFHSFWAVLSCNRMEENEGESSKVQFWPYSVLCICSLDPVVATPDRKSGFSVVSVTLHFRWSASLSSTACICVLYSCRYA